MSSSNQQSKCRCWRDSGHPIDQKISTCKCRNVGRKASSFARRICCCCCYTRRGNQSSEKREKREEGRRPSARIWRLRRECPGRIRRRESSIIAAFMASSMAGVIISMAAPHVIETVWRLNAKLSGNAYACRRARRAVKRMHFGTLLADALPKWHRQHRN